jgi:hypothetical protein
VVEVEDFLVFWFEVVVKLLKLLRLEQEVLAGEVVENLEENRMNFDFRHVNELPTCIPLMTLI